MAAVATVAARAAGGARAFPSAGRPPRPARPRGRRSNNSSLLARLLSTALLLAMGKIHNNDLSDIKVKVPRRRNDAVCGAEVMTLSCLEQTTTAGVVRGADEGALRMHGGRLRGRRHGAAATQAADKLPHSTGAHRRAAIAHLHCIFIFIRGEALHLFARAQPRALLPFSSLSG